MATVVAAAGLWLVSYQGSDLIRRGAARGGIPDAAPVLARLFACVHHLFDADLTAAFLNIRIGRAGQADGTNQRAIVEDRQPAGEQQNVVFHLAKLAISLGLRRLVQD